MSCSPLPMPIDSHAINLPLNHERLGGLPKFYQRAA